MLTATDLRYRKLDITSSAAVVDLSKLGRMKNDADQQIDPGTPLDRTLLDEAALDSVSCQSSWRATDFDFFCIVYSPPRRNERETVGREAWVHVQQQSRALSQWAPKRISGATGGEQGVSSDRLLLLLRLLVFFCLFGSAFRVLLRIQHLGRWVVSGPYL